MALLSFTITDATVTIRKLSPLDCKKKALKMMGVVVALGLRDFFLLSPFHVWSNCDSQCAGRSFSTDCSVAKLVSMLHISFLG